MLPVSGAGEGSACPAKAPPAGDTGPERGAPKRWAGEGNSGSHWRPPRGRHSRGWGPAPSGPAARGQPLRAFAPADGRAPSCRCTWSRCSPGSNRRTSSLKRDAPRRPHPQGSLARPSRRMTVSAKTSCRQTSCAQRPAPSWLHSSPPPSPKPRELRGRRGKRAALWRGETSFVPTRYYRLAKRLHTRFRVGARDSSKFGSRPKSPLGQDPGRRRRRGR